MSDTQFERAVNDWLEDRVDRTPDGAVEGVLLAIKTTPQERDLRVPWRFFQMPVNNRAVGLAAVALVAVVGAGALVMLTGGDTGNVATQPTAAPPASAAPQASPSAVPSASTAPAPATGIPAGWTAYTSPRYGYSLAYPEGWKVEPASVAGASDTFITPDNDLGIGVGKVETGPGADLATFDGLAAWAGEYCTKMALGGCETFVERAEPLCLVTAGDPCRPAALVRSDGTNPDDQGEYAFFGDWGSTADGAAPQAVVVLGVGRGDAYPGAAPYGGAVALLRTMLGTMGVTEPDALTPSPSPAAGVPAGFVAFTSPVYGATLVYPEGWTASPADAPGASDQFVNATNDFGVGFSRQPAGDGADLATVQGLTAWAQAYCVANGLGSCDTYAERTESLCLAAGGETCRPGIIVRSVGANPEDEGEYAFFGDWVNAASGATPTEVVTIGTGRGDTYPDAAPFGGAVQLLRTMIEPMGVTAAP